MTTRRSEKEVLDALLDQAVDATFETSDADILAEAKQEYANPSAHVAELRAMAAEKMALAKKSRLSTARAALDAATGQVQSMVQQLSLPELRARIQSLLPGTASAEDRLTLAFRNGEDMSEADLQSLLEDLEELAQDKPKDT